MEIIAGLLSSLGLVFNSIWWFLKTFWWIVVPVVLWFPFINLYLFWIRFQYLSKLKWSVLNVRIPREILKTPKAMEQIFAAAHNTYSFKFNPLDKYWQGKVELWTSFEIVGSGGGVYFYIRTPSDFKDMMESAIYAQYPDAEIQEVEDYIEQFPSILPNEDWDLFGTDLVLAREDAYPIRTWLIFESPEPEEKIDTMSALVEALSQLKGDETLWLQILARPTGSRTSKWLDKARALRDKLIGRKAPVKYGFWGKLGIWIRNFFLAFVHNELTWEDLDKPKEESPAQLKLTRSEQDIVRAIDNKLSKEAFEGVIRFVYIDRAKSFNRANIASVFSTFRQFNDINLNSIKPNLDMMTIGRGLFRWFFKDSRLYFKKRRIYDYYRWRRISKKKSIFNIEELATLYHFPTAGVEAPLLGRIEAKKGTPPMTLPVE